MRHLLNRCGDSALAAAVGFVFLGEVAFGADEAGHRAASASVALLFAASLLLRRTLPLVPLVVALVVIELNHTVLKGIGETGAFLFGVVIAIYSAGRYSGGRIAVASAVAVLAAIPSRRWTRDSRPASATSRT
jgi:hypothetical protein